jgi:PAS domain S-box-containing protein
MDPRFKKISDLLIDYSMGNFESQVELSDELDEVDSIVSGINLLGEELKTRTISRNYFNNIFNSVSDMIFVLDDMGLIENANRTAVEKLGEIHPDLIGLRIDQLLLEEEQSLFEFIEKNLQRRSYEALHKNGTKKPDADSPGIEVEKKFKAAHDGFIPVSCSADFLHKEAGETTNYLITVRDLSKQKEMENLVIHTIIDTQENERIRVARDLHDSLGQRLSAVTFYMETLININSNKKIGSILQKSGDALKIMQNELRDVCFNLMPKTLEMYGLIESVNELCRKIGHKNLLEFECKSFNQFPLLNKSLEIAIFRIVQEFINNSIKHGQATKIMMAFDFNRKENKIRIELRDNGKGFDKKKAFPGPGIGLKNVRSRIQSYNGNVKISSAPGRGTKYIILIPLNKNLIQN